MQKTKTKLITALLLATLALAIYPIAAFASTGFILIGTTTAPSVATAVPAGGNVSLYFGHVTFSGGQLYLLLSSDGFSQVSGTDLRYTPSFSLAAVQGAANTTVTDPTGTFPGTWYVGSNWISGTLPSNIAGGPYFIKAFDGATTSVAVTDIPLTVTASVSVAPTSGSAGTSLTITGNAFPSGALVNVTYLNAYTVPISEVTVSNLTATGSIGNFTLTLPAPDLKQAAAIGDNAPATNTVTFTAQENKTQALYTAVYTENQRGLLQIGRPATKAVAGNVMNATGIYGNLTSFGLVPTVASTTISVGVGDSVRIVGNWFYPGPMSIKWDNSIDITPSGLAANGTGYFNTTVTVPATGLGAHNVTILDNGLVVFAVFLNVIPSITINPVSGPIGTTVTVSGFGFPSAVSGTAYNATITFDSTATGWALTDSTGAFTTTITVPVTTGGAHLITATTNDTPTLTTASKTFTVTASFTISPNSFYANDSTRMVTASGTGFDPTKTYFVAIDNLFSPFVNTTNGIAANSAGNLSISFIGVGFQAGLHIVVLYQASLGTGGTYAPATNATFTVLADPLTSTTSLLQAINATVTQTNTTVSADHVTLAGIGANVTAIWGTVVTIQSATGTIQTTLSAINATLIAINGNTATLSSSIGTINTNIQGVTSSVSGLSSTISGISGSISSISNGVATVQTSVGSIKTELDNVNAVLGAVAGQNANITTSLGTITTSLSSIGTTVTSISGDTATILTDLGTITGTVTSISGDTATIKTDLGTMQTSIGNLGTTLGQVQTTLGSVQSDVSSTKTTTAGLSPLIIVAIVLALIAAIAAIASIVLMRRKIAG